jgi:predicted regulator of Ras-like GTPase activity (Roadblock/LC7/MglB family)/signal transduction histidine kinase
LVLKWRMMVHWQWRAAPVNSGTDRFRSDHMGVSSWAGPERPRAARRSIRFTFTAMVAAPAVCLVLLWGLAVRAMLSSGRFPPQNHQKLVEFALSAGGGLLVVLAAAVLMGSFARRLSRDISDLAATAQHLADAQSPQPAGQPRGGTNVAADSSTLRPRTKTSEIAQAVAAIARLQHAATTAAASEAGLRDGLRQVFVSLARRNQSLLQRQLRLIDALEQKASDPAALADLFSLDHLTTRMRRHAESVAILSGGAPGRSWRDPVPVIDVIRGAMAEVEDYQRVAVLIAAEDAVAGPAVADMIHLLAELIENATLFSPSGTKVEVRAGRVANGFALEIDDRGLGIEPEQLSELNEQLASPPDFDLADADRLGLFVGGKLAARHGVRISLRSSPYGGITAIVLMPNSIIVPAKETGAGQQPDARPASRPAELDLTSGGALAIAGQRPAPPSLSAADPPRPAPDGPRPGPPRPGRPRPGRPADRRHPLRPSPPHPPGELVPAASGQHASGRPPRGARLPARPFRRSYPRRGTRPGGFLAERMATRPPGGHAGCAARDRRADGGATGLRGTAWRGGVMNEQPVVAPERDLSWLLDDFAGRVGFRQAVILSRDGLVVAASGDLNREDAEHLSALAAGLQSLARGAGEYYGVGAVRQSIIELEQALLFVTAAGQGSCLAVLCPADADAGVVAYEMAMLVKRAGPHLVAGPRFPAVHSPVE